ncbi:NAD(P)/FAD-dependent oxidoreductase [Paenibacillus antri]|uniref:NAD(P)/FAD-dependent oxidoreductase n=1 Tax=Paenibacillus antri TaxID=2582848 RepID=A0A5R9GFX3_9BACL|nr:NAD(P)/FAD-dependent oxidoreductase [Paenibacillus antri]TLS51593.1 NAD(P)/FAD-dependent oxidoreductase [Paenibacillus antri]
MRDDVYDVVVIGGGIVGASILRKLSEYRLKLLLIEKQPDVCEGASKANSGIVHTGFDAKPGTVEAECLRLSRGLWPKLIERLKIPYVECGAVMVAVSDEERSIIEETYLPSAAANGVACEWIGREELLERNPAVTPRAIGGLSIPGEALIDPFGATRSFAEIAAMNGAEVSLGSGVARIEANDDALLIALENGREVATRYAVNAAGLWADEIAGMIGDDSFALTPRKGQFVLTEEAVPVSQIVLPVPTKTSKGILLSPVVFGGYLLGPTAEDQEEKWDRSTTAEGMEAVLAGCEKLVPSARSYASVRQFAGVRAVCSEGDFVIRPSAVDARLVHAAGIRSTGVSASPGIAELVSAQLERAGLALESKPEAELRTDMPELFGEDNTTEAGEIVCLCRSITRGEIANALCRPVAAATIDAVKRRTGALLGECQGNGCIPKIMDLVAEHTAVRAGQPPLKGLQGSYLAFDCGSEGGTLHEG